jgi:hypothetical protein
MTRGRDMIAAAVVAAVMALAGISHTGQTKATHAVAIDRQDNEQAGHEMSSSW